jgi:hypothetical protein
MNRDVGSMWRPVCPAAPERGRACVGQGYRQQIEQTLVQKVQVPVHSEH